MSVSRGLKWKAKRVCSTNVTTKLLSVSKNTHSRHTSRGFQVAETELKNSQILVCL